VAVYPDLHIVAWMFAWVTTGSTAPGVQAGSGSVPCAWQLARAATVPLAGAGAGATAAGAAGASAAGAVHAAASNAVSSSDTFTATDPRLPAQKRVPTAWQVGEGWARSSRGLVLFVRICHLSGMSTASL